MFGLIKPLSVTSRGFDGGHLVKVAKAGGHHGTHASKELFGCLKVVIPSANFGGLKAVISLCFF